MTPMISISELCKKRGSKQVLDNVALTVEPGQILGLVGPNGAGKTTCLQALLGLTSYEGNIDVLGHSPKVKRDKMLLDVAYIADVAVLPKWLKVNQAIDYMAGVHPKFNREDAQRFLAKTNIDLDAKIKTLSKGMVTQVHLALILAVDAKVLILDEPTLGLDILTRRQFYSHLLEDFYAEDKCIIVTTHQIEEIEHILTNVSFIKDGKITLSEHVDSIKSRYKLVAVTHDKIDEAKTLSPLSCHTLMGMTSMLFVDQSTAILSELGTFSSPTLSDIFVGTMEQEITA